MRSLAALAAIIAIVAPAHAEDASPKAPQWYLEDVARLTAGDGKWIADNSAYKSEGEPYDAYGTEWKSSFEGDALTGRLFGVKDGKETALNFWEFRQYWHPGRGEAVVEQFGWGGAVGLGTIKPDGDILVADQTFYRPGAAPARTGHKTSYPDAYTQVTESFDIIGDEWKPRRKYTWRRAKPDNGKTQ